MIDIHRILTILPHRYPFVLVDRILEIDPGKRIVGLKNITINEPYFQGHFPGFPIFPGVLIVEAMAQTWGICVFALCPEDAKTKNLFFSGLDKVRFRRPVIPGDQMKMEMELLKRRGSLWKFRGKATVSEDLVAEAELMASVIDKDPSDTSTSS